MRTMSRTLKGSAAACAPPAAATAAPADPADRHRMRQAAVMRSTDIFCSLKGDTARLYPRSLSDRLPGDSDAVDFEQRMAFLRRRFLPFPKHRIRQRVLEVRLRGGAQLCAVGLKAKQHGSEHGIGNAELAEQPSAGDAMVLSTD